MILRRAQPPHRRVVVPNHSEVAKGTLRAIIREVGLTADEFTNRSVRFTKTRLLLGSGVEEPPGSAYPCQARGGAVLAWAASSMRVISTATSREWLPPPKMMPLSGATSE